MRAKFDPREFYAYLKTNQGRFAEYVAREGEVHEWETPEGSSGGPGDNAS